MYNKEDHGNNIVTEMQAINLKLNIRMNILNFEDFTYLEEIHNPIFDEVSSESNFVFPVTTCSDSELIILNEN